MTSKNNRAPLLCSFKLYASFDSHQWIQTKVTFWKLSIRVNISDFLSRVTLKFEGWPWKIIGHLFHATSNFVYLWFDCNFVNDLVPRKCKDFNWKIFYGQVNTETRLEKMNMSNGMCVVCENGKENLEHLLIDCRHVYGIWDAVERL